MQTQILQILQAPDYTPQIQRGIEALSAGRLLVLPTETVYGVAGLLSHSQARASLSKLRKSSTPRPFTIHLAGPQDSARYLGPLNDFAQRMIRKLWPGPIGLIFQVDADRRRQVANELGLDEVDIYDNDLITMRCPDHRIFQDIVGGVKGPVALTTPPGARPRPADWPSELLQDVEIVFDAGQTRFSKPSTLLQIRKNSYEIVRQGVYDQRIIDRLLKTTILFVCSGNTCRSPMAEAIARNHLAQKLQVKAGDLDDKGISVISAGSHAMPGARATPQAVDVLREMGLDLSAHRSRPLTVELIHQADLIYTMSGNHARAVTALVPSARDKIQQLDPDADIEDPIGGDIELYNQVASQIKALIERRLPEGIIP